MKIQTENLLRENETIIWEGAPDNFPLFSKASAGEIIMKCVIVPLLCAYVAYLKVTHSDVSELWFIVLMILVAVIVIATLLMKKPQVMRQRYLMTGERIFLIKSGSAYYMDLNKIDGYRVVIGQTPQSSVVFGKEIFPDIKGHLLWRACAEVPTREPYGSQANEANECTAMVFFNIPQTAKLVSLLTDAHVKQA